MNIHVLANCITSANTMSGGDRSFIELCKRLGNHGANLRVYTPQVGYELCRRNGLSADYVVIESPTTQKTGVIFTYIARTISGSIIATKSRLKYPSVCYSTSDFLPDVIPARLMKRNNKGSKWIACIHLLTPSPFQNFPVLSSRENVLFMLKHLFYFLSQQIAIYFMKSADLVFVVNADMKRYLKTRGLDFKRIKIIDNGIDLKYVSGIRPSPKRYDAVFVGRFHRQKGLPDLLDIWEKVCRIIPHAELAIVGSGTKNWETKLRIEISKKKLCSNIKLLGFLGEAEKFSIMKSSKMFLFPSHYESWGIVACEAMACGIPVVAYNLPVYEEIFPQGMLKAPVGDSEKFAELIVSLLKDGTKCKKLGEDGLDTVIRYDWDKVAEKVSGILERS